MNFAAMFNNSHAIVGAPQYLLGTHLNQEFFYPMLEDIVGERSEEKIRKLDQHIREKYKNKDPNWKQTIYMQYSDKEYTYDMHIKYLIDDLLNSTIETHFEKLDYSEHTDVHKFFPDYLHRTINNILGK